MAAASGGGRSFSFVSSGTRACLSRRALLKRLFPSRVCTVSRALVCLYNVCIQVRRFTYAVGRPSATWVPRPRLLRPGAVAPSWEPALSPAVAAARRPPIAARASSRRACRSGFGCCAGRCRSQGCCTVHGARRPRPRSAGQRWVSWRAAAAPPPATRSADAHQRPGATTVPRTGTRAAPPRRPAQGGRMRRSGEGRREGQEKAEGMGRQKGGVGGR